MYTAARVAPFFDQVGMQRRQHVTDTNYVPPPLSDRPGRVHHFMAHSTVEESVKQDVVRPTSFDELGGQGEIRTFAQAKRTCALVKRAFAPARRAFAQAKRTFAQVNGMKTATRSTMQEGQA